MKRLLLILLMGMLLLPVSLQSPVAQAASEGEPLVLEGVLKGAPYRIVVPENWNGTLLVYARGYSPGGVETADAAFLAEEELLARGYALAGSALRGGGTSLDQFTLDLKYLTDFFKQQVGKPTHTVIYGVSMGGMLTLLSMEKFPGTYDAGIPICTPAAGMTRNVASRFSFALAYDAAFGWDESWGQVDDMRDDFNFFTEVWDRFWGEFLNPLYRPRWEFVRLVNGLPSAGYYTNPFPWPMGPGLLYLMFFSTQQRADLEVEAGGRVSQNVGYVYSLTADERAYLLSLDPTLDLDGMLAQMNAKTGITADPRALAYLRRTGEFSGRVHGPILMAHNVQDVIAPVEHTTEYANLMASVRTDHLLTRVYTDLPGHCMFTEDQMLALFAAMDGWLATGIAPGADAFPEELDFVHGFEPGPWPQPPQE